MWQIVLLLLLAPMEGLLEGMSTRRPGGLLAGGEADLTVVSGQDTTGHWLAKMRLEHITGVQGDDPAQNPVQLHFQRSARQLPSGAHAVAIEATLTGNRKATDGRPRNATLPSPLPIPYSPVRASIPPPTSPSPPPPPPPPSPTSPPTPSSSSPSPSPQRRVPPGYLHYDGLGYYRLHTVPVSWLEAKATCEREGAHLTVLNSQKEATIMVKFFHTYRVSQIWIGAHDLLTEGKFYTVFGQPLEMTGFAVWLRGEPSNKAGNEHCVSVMPPIQLNDENCNTRLIFLCELP